MSITSEMMRLTPEEDVQTANELIPTSSNPDIALYRSSAPPIERSRGVRHDLHQGAQSADPLKGVRYSKLTAPGPSGFRAEHLKEMLGAPRRAEAKGLRDSLCRLRECIRKKEAPNALRWITRTRLCWQSKKNGKPRPIKMGELLRSSYAKRYSKAHMPLLRRHFRKCHQWGNGIPGACEAMVRWRCTVEELVGSGTLPPMVAMEFGPNQHVRQLRVAGNT